MNQVQQFFEYIFKSLKLWVIIQPWELGIRVRGGKKVKTLTKGIYLRIPFFDSVYVQESRLRIVSLPVQTLTTNDLRVVTISGAIGYSIDDVEKLYDKLFHPETTIQNITMSFVTELFLNNKLPDLGIKMIQKSVLVELKRLDYGLDFEYFKCTNFAVVKTFRLIQDHNWISEGLQMDEKK